MTSIIHLWHLHLPIATLLLLFGSDMLALEMTVKVPHFAVRGGRAKLYCSYKLDDDASLYSLKWYKGDHQFYQYIPGNSVSKTIFFLPGIEIDMESTIHGSVVLQNLDFSSSGTYRCEVIAEAPVFHTKLGEGNMTVIDPPESAPVLEGGRGSYRIGDQVSVNCTSLSSRPAATLEWYVNDQLVTEPDRLREYKTVQEGRDGLETSVLGLSFTTSRRHFQQHVMRLKCVARIAKAYFQSQETSMKLVSTRASNTIAEGRRYFPIGSGGVAVGGRGVGWEGSFNMMVVCLVLTIASILTTTTTTTCQHNHHHHHTKSQQSSTLWSSEGIDGL